MVFCWACVGAADASASSSAVVPSEALFIEVPPLRSTRSLPEDSRSLRIRSNAKVSFLSNTGIDATANADGLVATGFDAITTPGGSGASTLAGSVSATFGELGHSLSGQAASVLSSFVIGEIADALHLPGTARGLFTVAGATAANQLVSNLTNGLDAFAGFDTAAMGLQLGNAFGSFFGSHLAQEAIPARTQGAALFGAAASTIGSIALAGLPVIGPEGAANHNVAAPQQRIAFVRASRAA